MKELIWLIPLFPLAGFLINGLLYLVSHRSKNAPGHGHASAEDGHGEARSSARGGQPPADRSWPRRGAPGIVQGPPHRGRRGQRRPRLPPRVRRDLRRRPEGLRGRRVRDAGPLPLDPARREPGRRPDPGRGRRVGRRRRFPARLALGADARVRDVRRLPHPRLLGRVHGPRRGLRPLLRVPEPLHVRDARPRPGRELPDALRRLGGRGPLLVPADRLRLPQEVRGRRRQEGLRRQPHRRLRLHPRDLRGLRALRLARLRDGLRGGRRQPGGVHART